MESKFLETKYFVDILFHCRPEGRKKGMLPSGRASLRASPFIRKYQRLVLDYGVPVAVLHDRAALAQNDLTGAGGGFSGIVLIEGTAVDGDVSGGAVLAVQRPLGGGALEGTAVNDDLCVVVGVDQVILIGIAGDLLGKFAAVDDNGTIIA